MWTTDFYKGGKFLYSKEYRFQDERANDLLRAQVEARLEHGADSFLFDCYEYPSRSATLNNGR